MKSAEALPVDSGLVNASHLNSGPSAVEACDPAAQSIGCRVCKALTKQVYLLFIVATAVLCFFPGLFPFLKITAHPIPSWRLFLDLTVYEVVLVDVLCKKYLNLPRPLPPHRNGFPSGHATFSFALATLIAFLYPVLTPVWYGLATVITWSRFHLKAHYFYQVFGGAVMGVLLGFLVTR